MAKPYRLTPARRLVNWTIKALTRLGLGGRHTYVVTARGRTTGRPYPTPVTLIENGDRWLVAPYGEVSWVRNARAAGEVTLARAGRAQTVQIEEVAPQQAAPVLREYLRAVPIVRSHFDLTPDSPLEAFEAEAPRHPVFRIVGERPPEAP